MMRLEIIGLNYNFPENLVI